jgi:hypothetical protein
MRLNKEKEALEISEASALLLHPNQFSLMNPASPGGTHGKRATRLRREMEDIPGLTEGKKRKRNPAEEDGSPAPQRRALDPHSTTPLWQGDRLTYRKVEGPIYSIDKLFTDKELSMTYNAAALAAHKHLLTHKVRVDENGRVVSSPEDSDSGIVENDDRDGLDSVPSAPMMERNVSHATRSARGGVNSTTFTDDKLMGLEALASFDFSANYERMLVADPKLPPSFPSAYTRGTTKNEYNTPTPLTPEDANADVMVMNVLRQYEQQHGPGANLDHESGARKVLEVAAHTARENRYVAYLQGARPAETDIRQRLGLPVVTEPNKSTDGDGPGSSAAAVAKGAVVTTPQSSPAKAPTSAPVGQIGGASMSRQSSASGAPMSRSSSRRGKARGF